MQSSEKAGVIVTLVLYPLYIAGGLATLYAIYTDARRGDTGWFLIDLFVWPVAFVRGVMMYFGWL